jgi:hypothetical protein
MTLILFHDSQDNQVGMLMASTYARQQAFGGLT